MLPPIFELLKNAAAVTAILGNPPKAYRHGKAPQNPGQRYVTWSVFGIDPEHVLEGPPTLDRLGVQVDCYHDTDTGVEALATAVRDAIEAQACMTGLVADGREEDTGLYRIGMQFDYLLNR